MMISMKNIPKKNTPKNISQKAYSTLKNIVTEIQTDVNAIKERDPAAKNTAEVLLLYSGLHAVLAYRVSHCLYQKKQFFAARLISQTARFLTGIEIHPGAKIGHGLFIDHGSAVVIGETAEIGDNCTLYQGVTLGGTGKDTGKRHPTLGDNVMVGAGAKVLGPFKIGSNSKIAANAVVLEEIPENATAVGIPARVVKRGNVRVNVCDLDQVHIPDPVSQELCRLQVRLEHLERQIAELKTEAAGTDTKKNTGAADACSNMHPSFEATPATPCSAAPSDISGSETAADKK